ncbi:MAG: YqjD family protein [Thermoanaerobaculia bacterium]
MAEDTETEAPAEAAERLEAAREKFSEVVDSKIRGIKNGASKATQTVKEQAGRVSAGAREKYEGARETTRQGYDRVTKDLQHLGEDVNEYVRQNPGKAIAIAIGAGFVLGILLRGRRD